MADTPPEGDAPRAPARRGRKARTPAADGAPTPKARASRASKAKGGDTVASKSRRAASATKAGADKAATPRKRTPAASRTSKTARSDTGGVTRKRVAVAGVVAAGVAAGVAAAVLGRKKLAKASNEAIDAVTGSEKNTNDTVPPVKDGMG